MYGASNLHLELTLPRKPLKPLKTRCVGAGLHLPQAQFGADWSPSWSRAHWGLHLCL